MLSLNNKHSRTRHSRHTGIFNATLRTYNPLHGACTLPTAFADTFVCNNFTYIVGKLNITKTIPM